MPRSRRTTGRTVCSWAEEVPGCLVPAGVGPAPRLASSGRLSVTSRAWNGELSEKEYGERTGPGLPT
ncbi:hypothetical protein NDU88_008175 [Pleurodeles waltl]|uniref:Uncharacterized protein n=1 Tax=Pleurodeles waltl TaxID=8319 RepID=A0AAV7N6F6_PLEWA|nr:hypothetical protein NDU88_008175 [Pleurodeles waltl]